MSTFTLNSITVAGLGIISRLVAGSTLEFTRIAIGDGAMPSDKTPLTVTDLTNRLFDVDINSVESEGTGSATVSGVFSNEDKEVGFFYRELGLFAKDPATGKEVLYCYGNAAADAEWISPSGASSIIEKEVKITTLVGNAETVTAEIKSGIYATKEELAEATIRKADLDAPAAEGGRVLAEQMRFDTQQTLYVDAAAAEGGDGSEAKPFKTIQAAINARYLGAAVIYIKIKAGKYGEDISVPRAPGTTWRLSRNGSGNVEIKAAVVDNCNYIFFENLIFNSDAERCIYIANTATAHFSNVTVNGAEKTTGIHFSNSRGWLKNTQINNCGLAAAATDNSSIELQITSGTGNIRGVYVDGSLAICTAHTLQATTPFERVNSGGIMADGGASSFPSNYSQLKNLGTFSDTNSLKAKLLQELGALKMSEAIQCSFISSPDFGPFGQGQTINCTINKTGNAGKGYGIILFYSDNPAVPAAFMQISDGNYAQAVPVAFVNTSGGTINGDLTINGQTIVQKDIDFPTVDGHITTGKSPTDKDLNVLFGDSYGKEGAAMVLKHKTSATQPGYFILLASNGTNNTELRGKPNGELTWGGKPVGLLVQDETELLKGPEGTTVPTPLMLKINDFRRANTNYSLGDKVACAFEFEHFLECTKAGTSSNDPLDTRNVTHGQIITDGTAEWTVRTHIKSINGVVAGADGNIALLSGLPVGSFIDFGADNPPEGYLVRNGAAVSRTTYAALFAVIGTKYGAGDGSTTFNLPNSIDRFSQGDSTAGIVKPAGLPNITGHFSTALEWSQSRFDGAFRRDNQDGHGPEGSAWTNSQLISFDASRSSAIYGASTTVQPPALTVLPCIKY